MFDRQIGRRGFLTGASALVLVGCSSPVWLGRGQASATKSGADQLRTDPGPLTTRFVALGSPSRVAWASGTMGGQDAPGPSTYWIDAVAWVSADVADTLRSAAPHDQGTSPSLVAVVADQAPVGPWLTSAALVALFAYRDWQVEAWLAADADVVVVSALGQ